MKHTLLGAVAFLSCTFFLCSCSSKDLVNLGLLYEHKEIPGSTLSYENLPLDYKKAAECFTKARNLHIIYTK